MKQRKQESTKAIRLDLEVIAALAAKRVGFENANATIRRILGLPVKKKGGHAHAAS